MAARKYTKSSKTTVTTHILDAETGYTYCGKCPTERWIDVEGRVPFEEICGACIDGEIEEDAAGKEAGEAVPEIKTVPPEAYRGGEAHPEDADEADILDWDSIDGVGYEDEETEFDPNAGFGYTMGEDRKPMSAFEAAAGEVLDHPGEPLNDAMLADADDYAKRVEDFSFKHDPDDLPQIVDEQPEDVNVEDGGTAEEPISLGPTDPGYDEIFLPTSQPTTTPLDRAIAFRNLVIDASVLSFKPASMSVLRAKIAAFQSLFDREPKMYVEGVWTRYWDIKRNKFVDQPIGGMLELSKVKTKWVTAHIEDADWDMDLEDSGIDGVYLV